MKINTQKPRGMRDILPQDQKYWQFVENTISRRCQSFNLEKIDTPIIEYKDIYIKGVGETSDIVEKEMYEVKQLNNNVIDKDDSEQTVLRPEFTAGIARSYIENGMQTWPQPVKLFSIGSIFRHDRPQKGRYRQVCQFNLEIIGDDNPMSDALLILIVWQIFQDINLSKDIILDINTIGCRTCRLKIRKKIIEYYKHYLKSICPDCQKRFERNPLRLFDCKNEKCQKIIEGAPQTVDCVCGECRKHFTSLLEYLDELQISYDLNPRLVRGLDYYTRTVFEIRDKNDSTRQSVLGGGGRYDNLIELLGGRSTPAIGFAGGMDRIVEKLKENDINVLEAKKADVYIIQIGEKAKRKSLPLIRSLGQKGIAVSCSFGKDSLKAQLKDANKMKAKIALIIGQREALDNSVIVKDMDEATQETIEIKDLENFLLKKLINI